MRRRTFITAAGAAASIAVPAGAQDSAARSPPTVVVFGATGRIGRDLAKVISDAGYVIRGVSRNPDRARQEISTKYLWVQADVRDFESVRAATSGADYVVSTIAADNRAGPQSPEFIDWGGNRNLIDAAREATITRFLLISSATSGPHVDQSLNPASGYVRYFKTKAEIYLRASGLAHTIIAPGRLHYEPGGKRGIRLLDRRDYEISHITSGDIGLVLVECLTNPDADGKAFALRNDDSLPLDAWKDMIAAMPSQ